MTPREPREAFHMVLADGRLVRCARDENPELFRLAMGGYGLLGVMVEVQLRTVPNALCRSERRALPLGALAEALRTAAFEGAELGFGRLDIRRRGFSDTALLTTYHRLEGAPARLPLLTAAPTDDIGRLVFRGEVGSEYGKALRWWLERFVGGESGAAATRNQLLSEPVERFENRRPEMTDVLFEAFVPPAAMAEYATEVRRIVGAHDGDLLNITVRHVLEDHDTVLRYATEEMMALVMLFSHQRVGAADERTARMTRALIDAALDHGGRYYLPYRPHASPAQLARAYPARASFSAQKRLYDPALRFRNRFWDRYFSV